MPKRKKAKETRMDLMKAAFLKRSGELWDEHIQDAMAILEDSETRKFSMMYAARFDFSESTSKLTTEIHFSQVHKDLRVDDFDDPRQTQLFKDGESEVPGDAPKKRKRKKADAFPEEPPTAGE